MPCPHSPCLHGDALEGSRPRLREPSDQRRGLEGGPGRWMWNTTSTDTAESLRVDPSPKQ